MDRIPVLYVNSTPELGGANIQLIQILKKMDLSVYRPIIVNPPQDVQKLADFAQFGEPIVTIRIGVIKRSYNPVRAVGFLVESVGGVRRLCRLIRRERIRIVHSNTSTVISGAIAAKLTGAYSVWHVHEVMMPKPVRAILCRLILALSDKVVAISNTVREQFPLRDRCRIEVVYDGIDLRGWTPPTAEKRALARRSLGLTDDAPLVGMVGRFVPWKGQETFVRACELVAREHPGAQFLMIGQTFGELRSYNRRLERLVRALGMDDRTSFEYWCEDIPARMSMMDIVVHASEKPEGFGLVAIEAMALGKPVIGTIGGIREIISNDVGLVVPPCDHNALADAINRLLADRDGADLMGLRGRDRVAEHFTIERTAEKISAVYQELLARKGAR
ncbi:MAG: glycosyltransferase [Actinobacteria bacterium]|nr:glycosyltransferase [Actinomycetota bacterium]